jgi:hypothetical protein
MKAIDTLHVSVVGPDNIRLGQTFEINDGDGAILYERGLGQTALNEYGFSLGVRSSGTLRRARCLEP